jgi:hypothetical protein
MDIGSKVTLVKDGRKTPNLNLMKTTSVSNPNKSSEKKTDTKLAENENKKPKAVMPKKE